MSLFSYECGALQDIELTEEKLASENPMYWPVSARSCTPNLAMCVIFFHYFGTAESSGQ